jgi:hypothetical protein
MQCGELTFAAARHINSIFKFYLELIPVIIPALQEAKKLFLTKTKEKIDGLAR